MNHCKEEPTEQCYIFMHIVSIVLSQQNTTATLTVIFKKQARVGGGQFERNFAS